MSEILINILRDLGFRRSGDSWVKDYGDDVELKITPSNTGDVDIEFNASIITNEDLSEISTPEDLMRVLLNLPAGGELLVSLFKAANDLMHIKLAMSMIN
ncbi:MAG: hypothetical protein AT714_01440 [Vulcanisaeta sp. OSP_8]|jgi:hypothetical protein|nr:MAG: hypothetical protein AT714_01440 [Vulcanisaeta sp. OSP_8]